MVCTRQSSASEEDQGAKSPLAGTSNKQKKKKKPTSKSDKLEFQYFPDQIRLSGCFFEISRILIRVGQTHIFVDYLQICQLSFFQTSCENIYFRLQNVAPFQILCGNTDFRLQK